MLGTEPGSETLCDRAATAFAAFQGGDRAELNHLVELVTPLLWQTVRSQGVDVSAAEDVVQTVWLRLLHSSATIRDPQTVVKWLLTSSRREAWRVTKRARTDLMKTSTLFGRDEGERPGVPHQRAPGPEETLLREDSQQQLWTHVRSLSERCQQLLRVIAFADRPDYHHIAESLGMPVGSIGPTRGRCLAKLRLDLASDPRWGVAEA
jgi:RNA polymerase sigma factor (sigma-70 family)